MEVEIGQEDNLIVFSKELQTESLRDDDDCPAEINFINNWPRYGREESTTGRQMYVLVPYYKHDVCLINRQQMTWQLLHRRRSR